MYDNKRFFSLLFDKKVNIDVLSLLQKEIYYLYIYRYKKSEKSSNDE
jgi:hypothetical protein